MRTEKKRSVLPIYAIAVVWILFTLLHPLYRVSDYASVILLSALVFVVAKGIWPTVAYVVPTEPDKGPSKADPTPDEAAHAAQTDKTADEAPASGETAATPEDDPEAMKIDALIQEKDRALSEMRRLNRTIQDKEISNQIHQLEDATAKIFDHVASHPEKLPQIRKFMTYYLPTTLKLLNTYDRMGATGVSGENIDGTMEKIGLMMSTIVISFQRQLDALFRDEALDVASDITVMENLLAREGLI